MYSLIKCIRWGSMHYQRPFGLEQLTHKRATKQKTRSSPIGAINRHYAKVMIDKASLREGLCGPPVSPHFFKGRRYSH